MVNVGRIRQLAKNNGLKMKYLCDQLGVSATYFADVDNGRYQMSSNNIYRLAELLHTTFEYLTNQTDDASVKYATVTIYGKDGKKQKLQINRDALQKYDFHQFDYDRYNERRIARHLTRGYVESNLNLPAEYWEDVRDGNIEADEDTVQKLAILLDTTCEYLMGQTDDPGIPADDKTGVKIKVFGDVAAGIPIDQIDNFDPDDPDAWEEINRWTAKNGSYFALKIKGDSMNPRFLNGDIVIVRQQPTAETGEIAVVAVERETATCKKISWDKSGGLMLMPLNPNFNPSYYSAADIQSKPVRILGKVVELRGKC